MRIPWARTAAAAALAFVLMAPLAHAATPSAFVYATNWGQTVRQYQADATGALSDLASPVPAGQTSTGAAASPDGRSLYVVNQTSGTVSQFHINLDGTLAPLTPASVSSGPSPLGVTVAHDGGHVYVVNQGDNTVGVYSVGSDGGLTLASTAGTGDAPAQVALSPDDTSAYVTNFSGGSISQYDVASDGSLTPKAAGATVPAGTLPAGVAVSADGDSVYAANQTTAGRVSQFVADPQSGALTPMSTPTVDAGVNPRNLLVAGSRVYVSSIGSSSVPNSSTISLFRAGADGSLGSAAATVAAPTSPYGMALSPDGASFYVAGFSQAVVGQYDVAADGTLTPKATPTIDAGVRPQAVVAVKPRDETAPTIDLRTPADGAQYALGEQVAADYSCADEGGSGLASCTGDVADGDAVDTSSPGDHAFTVVARDGAGNQATVTHHYSVAPDGTRPTVDLRAPEDGAQYSLGQQVAADYSCADEGGSGLASCTGDVADGDAIDTAALGPHQFTVVARDGAGNETTVTHGYTVVEPVLQFGGFFGPIHDGSVVRAGDVLPIVFSLNGYHGLDVLATGSPSSVRVDCRDPGEPTGGKPARSPYNRGLRFNQWTGHYVFTWQTDRSWAGTCRTFILTLSDGSVQRLTVSFRRDWYWHGHW